MRNAANESVIGAPASRAGVRVMRTDEKRMIAARGYGGFLAFIDYRSIKSCRGALLRRNCNCYTIWMPTATPGQNFIYVHLNRVIKTFDLNMIYMSGPGRGGPAVVSNTYLEGTYSEVYPNISQDEAGLRKLFVQFSFPGGIPSHASPECPGSIHERWRRRQGKEIVGRGRSELFGDEFPQ